MDASTLKCFIPSVTRGCRRGFDLQRRLGKNRVTTWSSTSGRRTKGYGIVVHVVISGGFWQFQLSQSYADSVLLDLKIDALEFQSPNMILLETDAMYVSIWKHDRPNYCAFVSSVDGLANELVLLGWGLVKSRLFSRLATWKTEIGCLRHHIYVSKANQSESFFFHITNNHLQKCRRISLDFCIFLEVSLTCNFVWNVFRSHFVLPSMYLMFGSSSWKLAWIVPRISRIKAASGFRWCFILYFAHTQDDF